MSADGKPPPREYWLDDAEIEAWKKDQKALKDSQTMFDKMGNPMRE